MAAQVRLPLDPEDVDEAQTDGSRSRSLSRSQSLSMSRSPSPAARDSASESGSESGSESESEGTTDMDSQEEDVRPPQFATRNARRHSSRSRSRSRPGPELHHAAQATASSGPAPTAVPLTDIPSGTYLINIQFEGKPLRMRLQLAAVNKPHQYIGYACDDWLRSYTVTAHPRLDKLNIMLQDSASKFSASLSLQPVSIGRNTAAGNLTLKGQAYWPAAAPGRAVMCFEAAEQPLGLSPLAPPHVNREVANVLLGPSEFAILLKHHGFDSAADGVVRANMTLQQFLCLPLEGVQSKLDLLSTRALDCMTFVTCFLFGHARLAAARDVLQTHETPSRLPPLRAAAPAPGSSSHARSSRSARLVMTLRRYHVPHWDALFSAACGLQGFLSMPLEDFHRYLDVAGTAQETELTGAVSLRRFNTRSRAAADGLDRMARAPWKSFATSEHRLIVTLRERQERQWQQQQVARRHRSARNSAGGHSAGSGTRSSMSSSGQSSDAGSDEDATRVEPSATTTPVADATAQPPAIRYRKPTLWDLLQLPVDVLDALRVASALDHLFDFRLQYHEFLNSARSCLINADTSRLLTRVCESQRLADAYFLLVACRPRLNGEQLAQIFGSLATTGSRRAPSPLAGLFRRMLTTHFDTDKLLGRSGTLGIIPHGEKNPVQGLQAPPVQELLAADHGRMRANSSALDRISRLHPRGSVDGGGSSTNLAGMDVETLGAAPPSAPSTLLVASNGTIGSASRPAMTPPTRRANLMSETDPLLVPPGSNASGTSPPGPRSRFPNGPAPPKTSESKPFAKGVKRLSMLLAFTTAVIWALAIVAITNDQTESSFLAAQRSSVFSFVPYGFALIILVAFLVLAMLNWQPQPRQPNIFNVLGDCLLLVLLVGGVVVGTYTARVIAMNLYQDGLEMDLVHVILFAARTLLLLVLGIIHHWSIRTYNRQLDDEMARLPSVVSDGMPLPRGALAESRRPPMPRWMEFSYFIIMMVQPAHFWTFLGSSYVLDTFMLFAFGRGVLLWDDWACVHPVDERAQADLLHVTPTYGQPRTI
ncbi:uncharacterized protein MONBRDRAFT_28973 [Monosiga brevicollis MX1]|uniref:Uncharacterized protein n=1 Tax=Monosiga brevicollis TaxID=81824 RepID=A9V9Q8_MONBE|nr:uncharacterized protein MONBRDRAFT_28973 [Monosiga brevicollis MX1]EDQ85765.1 predicted protein [Monosiga brevicollis MX1]|eukprot:XP_001749480.1 hypothetical protein [Monosiga brevicollis MX1]